MKEFKNYLKENMVDVTFNQIMEDCEGEYECSYSLDNTDDLINILCRVRYNGCRVENDDDLFDTVCDVCDNLTDDEFKVIKDAVDEKVEDEIYYYDCIEEANQAYYEDRM